MPLPLAAAGVAAAYRIAEALPQAAPGGAGFGAALTRAMEQAVEVGHQADASTTSALSGPAGRGPAPRSRAS